MSTTTDIQQQNVAAITEAYDAAAGGDPSKLLGLWHDDITISTWTLHGGDQRILTKEDAFAAFGVVAKLSASTDEVKQAIPVGDDIVITVNEVHRKYEDHELNTEIGCMFRFKDFDGERIVRARYYQDAEQAERAARDPAT